MMPQVRNSIPQNLVSCSKLLKTVNIASSYAYKLYMKHKWILCLDLGHILNVSHYDMQIFENSEIENTSGPKHFR
jgi:hypothetical protein